MAFVDRHLVAPPDPRDPSVVPIRAALNRYVETTLKGRASQDVGRRALGVWDRFLDLLDIDFVAELTLDAQDHFVQWRRDEIRRNGHQGSNGTIARELGVLKAALKDYWKRGFLTTVPHIRSVSQPPPRQRFLTPPEFQRLIAECKEPHLWRFVMIAVHTLQRPSAVLQLHRDQVDLVRNRIDFLRPGDTQTKKRRPVVPITKTLKPVLLDALRESSTGHVVEWDGLPVANVRTAFKKACRRAGIKDASPYTLRHTGATLMAAAGVPLRQIAGMLGHTETRTTELYAKHSPEYLSEAAQALDAIFQPHPGTPGSLPLMANGSETLT